MRFVLIIGLCLALAAPSYAGLYKWKDKDGKVHYTNDPSQIPLDQRNKQDMKKLTTRDTVKKDSAPAPAASQPDPAEKKIRSLKKQASDVDTQEVKRLRKLMQK